MDALQVVASKKVTIIEIAISPSTALALIPPTNVAVTNSNNSALSRISTRQGKKDWYSEISNLVCQVDPITTKVNTRLDFQLSTVVRGPVDIHTDTCVIGNNCLVVHEYDRWVIVTDYNPKQGCIKDLTVVATVIAYDCPHTGEAIVIRVNQDVYIMSIPNNLLCQ